MDEEILTGGHMNTVVRVGDTVRRRAGAWTPTIHRLLCHARERGVSWAPVPQGYDEVGREVLSFIAGDVPHEMPEWVRSDVVLTDVARALREWHDATSGFERAGAVWSSDAHEPGEVICHNDFAPYNCVFRDGRFVGAFDFDLCSPGPRLWDIAYTAYRYVPLMPSAEADLPDGARERSPFEVNEMCSRLGSFLATYAAGSVPLSYGHATVFDMAIQRLGSIANWTANHVTSTGNTTLEQHAQMYRAHARWIDNELRGRANSTMSAGGQRIDGHLERRAATQEDVAFLIELRRQTMTDHQVAAGLVPSDDERSARVLVRFDCAEILVRAGRPVGLLKVARDGLDWDLIQIQLLPELQGKGVGGQILKNLVAEARQAGASIRLSVLRQSPARRLYERLGFTVLEELEHATTMVLSPRAE